ncbi:MAG: WD40 repeat domain-containing protein [bacterium]
MGHPSKLIQVFILLFIFICFIHDSESSIIIHDAAFSPDGKMIGVGTDVDFQILDQASKNLIYSFPVPAGVKFLKWAPDSQQILLASWQEQETPSYSMLDIQQNRILFSFQEEIRWFYTFITGYDYYSGDGEPFLSINEKTLPVSTELGHPNGLTFSPDSSELAYITNEGLIRFRNTENGTIIREFLLESYQATSLGYTSDGEKLWVGIRFDTIAEFSDDTRILYLDSQNGDILEMRQILYKKQNNTTSGNSIFLIYEVRPDQKYALAVTSVNNVTMEFWPTVSLYMVDLIKGETAIEIAGASLSKVPIHRAFFSDSGAAYGLEDVNGGWDTTKYDEISGFSQVIANDNIPYHPVPAHPFAPDGSQF